jgi:hypothetical protein
MYTMMYMSVISIRVDDKVKKILKESGVDINREVKRFLEDLAWKIEVKRRVERLNILLKDVSPAKEGFSTSSVREDRESN